jgi:hypothetical protein
MVIEKLARELVYNWFRCPDWVKDTMINWSYRILERKCKTPDFLMKPRPNRSRYAEIEKDELIKLREEYSKL